VKLTTDEDRAWWACSTCGTSFMPMVSPAAAVDPREIPEYLSIAELAKLIPYAEGSIRNMMSRGEFRRDVHYVKTRGKIAFLWPKVQEWMHREARRAG
jgi:hypothetical protein